MDHVLRPTIGYIIIQEIIIQQRTTLNNQILLPSQKHLPAPPLALNPLSDYHNLYISAIEILPTT